MNARQKIAISVGLIFIILSGLFPPYEGGGVTIMGGVYKVYVGYYPLWAPPTTAKILKALAVRGCFNPFALIGFRAYIAVSRIMVQLATIVLATVGLVLLLRGKKKSGKDESGLRL
jgi:hypothetical protein